MRWPHAVIGLASILIVTGCSCAARQHAIEPYRSDPASAAALEERAAVICAEMGHPDGLPGRRFITDGCSASPDMSWGNCCVEHDIAYWCGGTSEQRAQADRELRACVAQASAQSLGYTVQAGVRIGGHPWWPTTWRWGYGRSWPSGYVCEGDSRASAP